MPAALSWAEKIGAGCGGGDGPLHVSAGHTKQPLFQAWLEAGCQAGYKPTADLNGYQQEGLGPMDMTTWKGRRWSAAKAYLRPAMGRPNLTVETRALSHRVHGDAKLQPYECGVDPIGGARERFSVRYYLIAMLFLIFDVEAVFLIPWGVIFDKLSIVGLIEMVVFIGILVVGFYYAWRKGALEWV